MKRANIEKPPTRILSFIIFIFKSNASKSMPSSELARRIIFFFMLVFYTDLIVLTLPFLGVFVWPLYGKEISSIYLAWMCLRVYFAFKLLDMFHYGLLEVRDAAAAYVNISAPARGSTRNPSGDDDNSKRDHSFGDSSLNKPSASAHLISDMYKSGPGLSSFDSSYVPTRSYHKGTDYRVGK